ncbi:MAG: SsrA-binding protein SmpB [Desulfuromonadaceae bacterium]|nr:SsrA-binding protein SmpB [Desulfuromonadaceae bacterium]
MGIKLIANNKKAFHEFFISEVLEVGLALLGPEVKSLRDGKANLRDSYCRIQGGELFVHQMHISPYGFSNRESPDPLRARKLLVHRHEIDHLAKKVDEKGLTLVPTKLYFKNGRVKLEIGVAKGKQLHDKRETLKEKEARREMDKARKGNY